MTSPSLHTPDAETRLVARVTAELTSLSADARLRVLAKIMALLAAPPVPAAPTVAKAEADSILHFGVWQDERTAEEIIADIYAARTENPRPLLDEL